MGPKIWNKLPNFVRRSQSIEAFQEKDEKVILGRD